MPAAVRSKSYADPNTGFAWLRTLGALTVVVDHSAPLIHPERLTIFPASWHMSPGYVALMGFFAMSGFQIQDSWSRDPSWWRFSARRLLRILPPLVVVVACTVFVIGPLVTSWSQHDYWSSLQTWRYLVGTTLLFLLQHQLPGVFDANPYPWSANGALWTLPMEMLGYAIVLVVGLLVALGVTRLFLFVVLAVMVFADSQCLATFGYHGGGGSLLELPLGSTVAFLVPFVVGMVLHTYRDRVPFRPSVAFVLLALWVVLNQTPVGRYALVVAASYGAITWALHWPRRLERTGAWVYGSYGTYIWAFPIQQLLVMAGVRNVALLVLLAVPASYLVGQLSWRLVEEPTMRLRRHLRAPAPNPVPVRQPVPRADRVGTAVR
ncbi:acyltransferase family protein [Amycolatopsis sacchari]|uniref:Peptidoglycan/LPS O-acetylase OafA/YrhL, contains acyltransferase and SGNH-hydrolase domains n=1 Tax=Amycolatopsis sacchari TaxID=115433 RepID=A0A1I3SIB8_9PSEU|nr:acyltransferase [Amycolatopsis sacchari]SFJ57206.1 Peptidoglycan/LPS O-acetylase OafA/YrhL, contains acyltransferase and SGNH-hydrolase domains [Amycolatopsis sacchari]